MNEVKKRYFLSFEYKKIILPIILILLFSYQAIIYYRISFLIEDINCKSYDNYQLIKTYREKNNSEKLKQTAEKWQPVIDKYSDDLERLTKNEFVFKFTKTIDPFFPVPCESVRTNYCRYYISKESYECSKNMILLITNPTINSLFETKIPEYKQVSIYLILMHLAILFILGYLISAIIFFILRNVKIKW